MKKFENRYTASQKQTRDFFLYQTFTSPKRIVMGICMLLFLIFGIIGLIVSVDLRFVVPIAAPVFFFIYLARQYAKAVAPAIDAQKQINGGKEYDVILSVDEEKIEVYNSAKKTTGTIPLRFLANYGKTNKVIYLVLFNNTSVLFNRDGFTMGTEKEFLAFVKDLCKKNEEGQKAARKVRKQKLAEQKKSDRQ